MLKVLTDILLAIDSGDLSALVLPHLSAAFDTVDHDILIQRLRTSYGLSGMVLHWFQSYLAGRRQYVRTGSSASFPTLILCGVPQRSVLGPILFLLYTADLIPLIQSHGLCPRNLYADDTQIYGFCRPAASLELQNNITSCVDDVASWMRSNRLQLNAAKTEILWSATGNWTTRLPDWCFLRRGTTTSLRSSVSCTGSRLRSELTSSLLSLYTSAYMEQHPRTLLMNSACRRISAHDVGFVQRHLHHWSSAVRVCQPSATELFLSLPNTCGTVCRST